MAILSGQSSQRLSTRVCKPSELSRLDRVAMCRLLQRFFENVVPTNFENDLDEKDWAVLLVDDSLGTILAFTTLLRLETVAAGERIVAYYSGDTIADPDAWGTTHLHRSWAHHVWNLALRETDARVYWLLVSCGYRTYRFLPVFFNEFYPHYDRATPDEVAVRMAALANLKLSHEFDPTQGVVCFKCSTPVRAGISDITDERLRDEHVAFYAKANPGYIRGDGLVCLAEISPANLTAAARRLLRS